MPEVLSSLPAKPLAANPSQTDSAVSQPSGAQAASDFSEVLAAHTAPEGGEPNPGGETAGGNSAQPGGQILPEMPFAAVSGAPLGDGAEGLINLPSSAADKDTMEADGAIAGAGSEAADNALPLPAPVASIIPPALPAAVQAATVQTPPVNAAENVVALRTAGAKTLPSKAMPQGQGQTASTGLTQGAVQAGPAEHSTLELIKSADNISTAPARAGTSGTAGQISALLLFPASSSEQATVMTAHGAAPATQPAPSAPLSLPLPLPLERHDWSESLGHRVLWMVKQERQIAELQLNPPHLGPLELRVTVDRDETSIAFSTPHATVRDALEAALPRLREMLGASGLTLGQVNISQQSFAEQRQSGYGGYDYPRGAVRSGNDVTDETASISLLRHSAGVIDLYA